MKKLFALLLVVVMLFALVSCNNDTAEKTEKTDNENTSTQDTETNDSDAMSFEEFTQAAIDDEVTVITFVQDKQSWWEDKATVYTQNEEGAYFLYEMQCSEEDYEKLVPGTKIKVTGYKAEWSGEIEIANATFEILTDETFIAEPVDVTEFLGKDELADYQNQYVSFKGLTVAASKNASDEDVPFLYNWDGSGEEGNDLYFNVSLGDQVYSFTVESYLRGSDTDVYKAVKELKIGDTIDCEGFLYWYEGANPHITVVEAAQ